MNKSIFHVWKPQSHFSKETLKKVKSFNLNFGPQHPAAHGVLRLILQLNGEIIEKNDTHIGLLHRGTEKLMEDKIYLHSLPYFDRLDYVSMLIQEHAYCLSIEKLLKNSSFTATFVKIRTLYDELTRILNHMLAISCHALDVGSMSPIFWAFEEREKIMEFYERVSGARMHAAFYRPNEINTSSISLSLLEDIVDFTKVCFTTLNEIQNILTYNKIWKQRLVNIGVCSTKTVLNYGLTGVMSRSVGFKRDVRIDLYDTYANYYYLNFKNYIGLNGDCYDRFLIRMNEMTESLNIITQVIKQLVTLKKKNYLKYKLSVNSISNFKWAPSNEIQKNLNFFDEQANFQIKFKLQEKYSSKLIKLNKKLLKNNKNNLFSNSTKNSRVDYYFKLDYKEQESFKEEMLPKEYFKYFFSKSKILTFYNENSILNSSTHNLFNKPEIINKYNQFLVKYSRHLTENNQNDIIFYNLEKLFKLKNISINATTETPKLFKTKNKKLFAISQKIIKKNSLIKKLNLQNYNKTKNNTDFNRMENVINHFKYWSEGFIVNNGVSQSIVESPKGEFGVCLISDGSNKPYRCKIRSPSYHHLQLINNLAKGHFLADLVTLVGTIDIVFGEIDR